MIFSLITLRVASEVCDLACWTWAQTPCTCWSSTPTRVAGRCPAFSHKAELRLGECLDDANRLTDDCAQRLRDFVHESLQIAEDKGVHQMLAFATSAVRDAANGDELLAQIEAETNVEIKVLPGPDEARLTFLAARRWFGWSSGRLLLLDIGGGSLEIATGLDEEPDDAVSLSLGAGRLTRDWLPGDPPSADEVRKLRRHVRAEIATMAGPLLRNGPPNHAVATSKTFRQLARNQDIQRRVPSVAAIKRQLGWAPKVDLKTAIKLTLDYHLAHEDYQLD